MSTRTDDQDGETAEMTAPVTEDTTTAAETPEVDEQMTAFEQAVGAVVTAPEDEHAAAQLAVQRLYHQFDRKGKAGARKHVEDEVMTAILAGDVIKSQVLVKLKDEMIKPIPVPRKPSTGKRKRRSANPTAVLVERIAAIQVGYAVVMTHAESNQEMDADWRERVSQVATPEAQVRATAYADWLRNKQQGAEPDANDVEKAAARVSLGLTPRGSGRKPKESDAAVATKPAKPAEEPEEDPEVPEGTEPAAPAAPAPEKQEGFVGDDDGNATEADLEAFNSGVLREI